jgi:hypothetical protein
MNPKTFSDSELLQKTQVASKNEKDATLELLKYLIQVDERRAYATLACSSLFEYVHRILGYSEMQTSERVNSVRLMRAVPEVEAKIESGDLSMSTASQVQRFLRQEKKVGKPVSEAETLNLIETCAEQSKREVEKTLFSRSSEEALATAERTKTVSESLTELKFLIPDSTFQKLKEVKDLIGNDSLKDIFDQALDVLLAQTKKRKGMEPKSTFPEKEKANDGSTSEPTDSSTPNSPSHSKPNSRFIPMSVKRFVNLRAKNRCEFIDESTHERCASTHRLQFDHYPLPFALGGKSTEANLRKTCFQHNQKAAMQGFFF